MTVLVLASYRSCSADKRFRYASIPHFAAVLYLSHGLSFLEIYLYAATTSGLRTSHYVSLRGIMQARWGLYYTSKHPKFYRIYLHANDFPFLATPSRPGPNKRKPIKQH